MDNIPYRTALFMAHRIRHALKDESFAEKLDGTVEADECFVPVGNIQLPQSSPISVVPNLHPQEDRLIYNTLVLLRRRIQCWLESGWWNRESAFSTFRVTFFISPYNKYAQSQTQRRAERLEVVQAGRQHNEPVAGFALCIIPDKC